MINSNFQIPETGFHYVSLGGSQEIGSNCNLYSCNNKLLIVDCGLGFASKAGVEVMVPHIEYLVNNKEKILGLIITHIHEDHCGGLQYLLQYLPGIRIIATRFCVEFLKKKLEGNRANQMEGRSYTLNFKEDDHILLPERENSNKIQEKKTNSDLNDRRHGRNCDKQISHDIEVLFYPTTIIEDRDIIKVGPFDLHFLNLPHSCPEMTSVFIRAECGGSVYHTGDWKFDYDPVLGESVDFEALKQIGKEGVSAIVCDSTNVHVEGKSDSEGSIKGDLEAIVIRANEKKSRVIFCMFTSNVARIHTLFSIAKRQNRIVCLAGRAVCRIFDAALAAGYLNEFAEEQKITEAEVNNYDPRQIMIICTGCQAEPKAALTRMVEGTHSNIKINPSDIVVFSAKMIPGNERRIYNLFNTLITLGCELITPDSPKSFDIKATPEERKKNVYKVHVSGHPAIEELKSMYELIKPCVSIPVHGEALHIKAHIELVKNFNLAKKALFIKNGDVVRIDKDGAEKVGEITDIGVLYIDGTRFRMERDPIFESRKKMYTDGLIVLVVQLLNVHKHQRDARLPSFRLQYFAPGLLDAREEKKRGMDCVFVTELEKATRNRFDQIICNKDCVREGDRRDSDRRAEFRKQLVTDVKKLCDFFFGKRPDIKIIVLGNY